MGTIVQVRPEHWVQPEEQSHLQLFPLPVDGVGHPRGGGRRLLRPHLRPGLQEGLLRPGACLLPRNTLRLPDSIPPAVAEDERRNDAFAIEAGPVTCPRSWAALFVPTDFNL